MSPPIGQFATAGRVMMTVPVAPTLPNVRPTSPGVNVMSAVTLWYSRSTAGCRVLDMPLTPLELLRPSI